MRVEAGQLRQWCDHDDRTVRYDTFLVIGMNRLRSEGGTKLWSELRIVVWSEVIDENPS